MLKQARLSDERTNEENDVEHRRLARVTHSRFELLHDSLPGDDFGDPCGDSLRKPTPTVRQLNSKDAHGDEDGNRRGKRTDRGPDTRSFGRNEVAHDSRIMAGQADSFLKQASGPALKRDSPKNYPGRMGRRYRWSLVLLIALASCTSAPRPSPTAETTAPYARYYFVEPRDTGVFEVWAHPATICYSTQSDPARPIVLVARLNGMSREVASYQPRRVQYCDREVREEVAAHLIADPSSFAVRWSPQTGQPIIETPLTTPG